MAVDKEFFNVQYKEGSLDRKTAQLVFFAACIAIGHESGARRHAQNARDAGATDDELNEAMVCAMRPAAAKVRELGKLVIGK